MNVLRINNKQQGMTLIEILIALVLGSFLLAGVYKIFISSNQNYRMQEGLSRMQESGRFAMEFISRDVRMADLRACYLDTTAGGGELSGFNNTGMNNSDVIAVLQKDDACGVAASASTFSAVAYFIKADVSGEPALFRVTTTGQTLASPPPVTVPLTISVTDAINLLIGAAGDVTVGTSTANQALMEGIEDMQILYGEDTDADGAPNHFVDSNVVTNMNNVKSVRISLLVHSLNDRLTSQPIPYYFNGVLQTPTDRRLRQTYTSTIGIRNRF